MFSNSLLIAGNFLLYTILEIFFHKIGRSFRFSKNFVPITTFSISFLKIPENWIDFNMFGHQFVTHLNPQLGKTGKINQISNPVDGHGVPIPHFGVVMNFADWEVFAEKVSGFIDDFIIEPYVRFKGEPGEQGTLFFADPSGNALEFKGFRDIESELFAK